MTRHNFAIFSSCGDGNKRNNFSKSTKRESRECSRGGSVHSKRDGSWLTATYGDVWIILGEWRLLQTSSSILFPIALAVITILSPLLLVSELPGFAMQILFLFVVKPVIYWHWGIIETGSKPILVSGEWLQPGVDQVSCNIFWTESYVFLVSDICFPPRMELIPLFLFSIGSKHILVWGRHSQLICPHFHLY